MDGGVKDVGTFVNVETEPCAIIGQVNADVRMDG